MLFKSFDWFLYDIDFRHERVNPVVAFSCILIDQIGSKMIFGDDIRFFFFFDYVIFAVLDFVCFSFLVLFVLLLSSWHMTFYVSVTLHSGFITRFIYK